MKISLIPQRSERKFGSFAWDHMPAELKPNFKRKLTTKNGQAKVAKLVNVEETFKALIQKEASGNKKLDMTREDQKDSDDEDVCEFGLLLCSFFDYFFSFFLNEIFLLLTIAGTN